MKKAASLSSSSKNKSNPTPSLEKIGFKTKKAIGGKEHEREIEEVQPLDTFSCSGRRASFQYEQDLGEHEVSCAVVKVRKRQKQRDGDTKTHKLATIGEKTILKDPNKCSDTTRIEQHAVRNTVMLVEAPSTCSISTSTTDDHETKRGSSRRTRHANNHKASMMQFYEN